MKIIINADDMGRSDIVNQSIIAMHKNGVVSSTTLMANGPKFKEAAELLLKNPELGVGVHLCLDGPYNSDSNHKTLINPETGSFYNNKEVVKRIRENSFNKDEIYKEFSLQVEKVMDQGIGISHLDTHHNLHLYFPVLSQLIRIAKKYKISYIRSQRLETCIPKSRINKIYRQIHQLYLNMRLQSVHAYYDPAMDECPDIELNKSRLEQMLNSTKGIMEIMVHPLGEDDVETRFFSSPQIKDLLSAHSLINYNSLK